MLKLVFVAELMVNKKCELGQFGQYQSVVIFELLSIACLQFLYFLKY